jgi:hypothetical protein
MISKDMKYTALYWALRFIENDLDIHKKSYNGYEITIYAEKQYVDFGNRIKGVQKYSLDTHKSFVVLECVDRLLTMGYQPEQITINKLNNLFDICLQKEGSLVGIECIAWDDYDGGCDSGFVDYEVVYTSRLVSGLLEYKGEYYFDGFEFSFGFGSDTENVNASSDFEIVGKELVRYKGQEGIVVIPEGIDTLGASAFWNNTYVKEVVLPSSLKRIGGDCFYYCTNLERVTIPKNVWIMGNNPFAGCPKLSLKNESEHFVLEDGVLYDKDKTMIIYFPVNDKRTKFAIPEGVSCIGKHCFFACDNLEKITIPSSVIRLENNPFSGCTKLNIKNYSPYYHFENGVIYNKFKTTIIGCLNGSQIERFEMPDSVTLISRNSFWNCKGIKHLVIGEGVNRIGYNPFANCENLLLESKSPYFPCENGIIFNKDKTQILCATNKAVGKSFSVPDGIKSINRGVFSGCVDLEEFDFGKAQYIDKSSFTNCKSLKKLYIPDTVKYIGEWAFSYCTSLEFVSIPKHTKIDKNAFNECPVTIERR